MTIYHALSGQTQLLVLLLPTTIRSIDHGEHCISKAALSDQTQLSRAAATLIRMNKRDPTTKSTVMNLILERHITTQPGRNKASLRCYVRFRGTSNTHKYDSLPSTHMYTSIVLSRLSFPHAHPHIQTQKLPYPFLPSSSSSARPYPSTSHLLLCCATPIRPSIRKIQSSNPTRRRTCATLKRSTTRSLLLLERQRERIILRLLLLRQLPSNIILRAQTLAALLQRSEIARRHHSGAFAGGARGG